MRFVDFDEGSAADLMRISQRDMPLLAEGKVIVKVAAFGINRADTLQRAGAYPPPKGESDILGLEISGTVVDVNANETRWQVGDDVFGLVAGGGYAEYVSVDSRHLMKVPKNLDLVSAAGVAEVFLTAYQSLKCIGQIENSGSVLIHAGASGVGLAAIQLCRLWDVYSVVTASTEPKLSLCGQQGANTLINYKEEDYATSIKALPIKGVDLVLDFVGGDYLNRNLRVLNQDGKIVYLAMLGGRYADKLDMALLLSKRATIVGTTLRNRSDEYKAQLVDAFAQACIPAFEIGRLLPNVDTVYGIEDVATTHQRLEANQTAGKLIVAW